MKNLSKNRIEEKFDQLKAKKQKALITFFTAGDPSLELTEPIIHSLSRGGADIIEVGVPFSDPMADGPVIQRASERALQKGVHLKVILKIIKSVRKTNEVPILLMGYYNPILKYGLENYFRDLADSGVDGTLIVDLPPEEGQEAQKFAKKYHISLIFLLAPTSRTDRIQSVLKASSGFIYYVSLTGITGSSVHNLETNLRSQKALKALRKQKKLPISIGFGIKYPEQAKKVAHFADGVVVGSALVAYLEAQKKKVNLKKLEKWTQSFSNSLRQTH